VSLTSAFEVAKQIADFVTYHWAVQMGRKDLEFVEFNPYPANVEYRVNS
jgi:hypothetical protein